MSRRELAVLTALVLVPWAGASAQTPAWPADSAYTPWPCQVGLMIDEWNDESGAIDERDLVGNDAAPAGLRAADSQFLYVRLRVDDNPDAGGARSWGLLIDTDGDALTYEVMLAADGGTGGGTVLIYENPVCTPGYARDAPETLVFTYSWAERARSSMASGSSYGGNQDYFVDLAYTWSDLAQVGMTQTTPIRVWAATSTGGSSNGMQGDFACWNGGASVALNENWPQTVAAPDLVRLAGGGGCHHGQAGWLLVPGVLLALSMLARRRASRAA